MRLLVTQDILEQLFDPAERDPEREARRQDALKRGRERRARNADPMAGFRQDAEALRDDWAKVLPRELLD